MPSSSSVPDQQALNFSTQPSISTNPTSRLIQLSSHLKMSTDVPTTTTESRSPYPPLPETLTSYSGSCHCRTITYTLSLDLKPSNSPKCNCTICVKQGKHSHMLSDPSQITLLSPLPSGTPSTGITGTDKVQAALDSDELKELVGGYQYNRKVVTHYFCKKCGVHPFTIGMPMGPEKGLLVGVNVNAIDGLDFSQEEWMKAGFYVDGRGDFKKGFANEPYAPGRW